MKKTVHTLTVLFFILLGIFMSSCVVTQNFSNIFVPEEGGINFVKITNDADAVVSPGYDATDKKITTTNPSKNGVSWYKYPIIAVTADGEKIGYIAYKNDATNVMIKSTKQGGSSIQQTFRSDVRNFVFSQDDSKICYSEYRDGYTGIYMMNFNKGNISQRVSPTGVNDRGPSMSQDGNIVFFDRYEGNFLNFGLWSFNFENGLFTNYSHGFTPCTDPTNDKIIYCARYTYDNSNYSTKTIDKSSDGSQRSEIWKIDTENNTEELLLSDRFSSFSSPQISPDGKWILVTGANKSNNEFWNTNIFVIRSDGTKFTQLTYHPGNDMSAVWSHDGKSIFFVSQRGSENGLYNVWKMDFQLY